MLGQALLPDMLKRGYHPTMAMGPIMAIGGVDMLIPPSALTVLLATLASGVSKVKISVADLLIAGILPGLIMSAAFLAYIVLRCRANPALAPAYEVRIFTARERWLPFLKYVVPLFLIFVVVQATVLFGGHRHVLETAGLTYSEYARRGFFELATVAALVLPLLLGLHWLLRKENPAHERVFRALAGVQVALLFVIMASAAVRMQLYQFEYGLTELRLYTLAFIGWLGVVFLWFALTVLIGKRERFVFGAMLAGFLAIAAMHVINPDALIVRTNITRVGQGRSFDAKYAARRSADAVPQLVAGLPLLSHEDQCTVASTLLERWSPPPNPDWRTWSRGRAQAWEAVQENTPSLTEIRSGCPQPSQPKDD